MKPWLAALCVCSLMLIVTAVPVGAISLFDVADGFASSGDNFSTTFLGPFSGGPMRVALNGGSEDRAALEFDISSIPSGASIVSATLQLWFVASDQEIGVHGAAGNGTIAVADFTFSNQLTTFDPSNLGVPTLNEVDVTAFIQGAATQFVVFQLRELHNLEFNDIVSGRGGDFSPRLLIATAIPAPASLLLVVPGLLGLGTLAWKRRR